MIYRRIRQNRLRHFNCTGSTFIAGWAVKPPLPRFDRDLRGVNFDLRPFEFTSVGQWKIAAHYAPIRPLSCFYVNPGAKVRDGCKGAMDGFRVRALKRFCDFNPGDVDPDCGVRGRFGRGRLMGHYAEKSGCWGVAGQGSAGTTREKNMAPCE